MTTRGNSQQGGCFCGAVRISVTGKPLTASACHCRDCQQFSGAAFLPGAIFRADQVSFLAGEARVIDYGAGRHRTFCACCGSHLTFYRDDQPRFVEVFTVCLDNPEAFHPEQHIWYRRHLSWVELTDALPRYATEPEDDMAPSSQDHRGESQC